MPTLGMPVQAAVFMARSSSDEAIPVEEIHGVSAMGMGIGTAAKNAAMQ